MQQKADFDKQKNTHPKMQDIVKLELSLIEELQNNKHIGFVPQETSLYECNDWNMLPQYYFDPLQQITVHLQTLEELLERDKKREEDGFPRRIRLGKLMKPTKDKKSKVIVVPTTTEPKFYHDDSITEDGEQTTGGSGDGEEGEVIGQQQPQQQQGDGEGQGAGQGEGGDHEMSSQAFDLGKLLTEKFQLPNLKNKGKKRAFSKYTYELTDINRRFGQLLEKKATFKRIIETNIQLGHIDPKKPIDTKQLIISPDDLVYRILSQEKDFETQAVVFFIRDYSGSMQGKPTEAISTQHLFIYSWLMYQYQNNVETRFILHDTQAKEVPDFHTYYQLQIAGGTRVAPAFQLAEQIIVNEQLAKDYNIYIFYGTDGDDWDDDGKEYIEVLRRLLTLTNRIGITVAKNSWSGSGKTNVEKNTEKSGLLDSKAEYIKIDTFSAEEANEKQIIESIKKLVS
jgi:uncharacterized sporulation protein YeaH/YhbH (DUF444 family)